MIFSGTLGASLKMKRKQTIYDVNTKWVYSLLNDRKLTYKQVYVTKHFVERFTLRRIEPRDIKKAIDKIADNICTIIYNLETGKRPSINHGSIKIELDYFNGRVYLMTCYDTSNNH